MNISKNAQQLHLSGPGGTGYYGGDQGWFSSNTHAMGGCSSVAGANALRLLCRKNEDVRQTVIHEGKIPAEVKRALCSDVPTKDEFGYLMTGMYKSIGTNELFPINKLYDRKSPELRGQIKLFRYLKPSWGRTSIGFIAGIIRFAKKCGVNIRVRAVTTAFCDEQSARDFIEEGLEKSGAVVMLTSYNRMNIKMYPADSNFEGPLSDRYKGYDASTTNHFTTITDMQGDRILLSTWGKPVVADFGQISKSWRSIKAYESTLLYIEPSTLSEARKCKWMAWKPFFFGFVQTVIRRRIKYKF